MMRMHDFDNWKDLSKGYYRYVVGANVCYEIQIVKFYANENILQAEANLYLVGEWHDRASRKSYFERELLCAGKTVQELVKYAQEDFDKNMK